MIKEQSQLQATQLQYISMMQWYLCVYKFCVLHSIYEKPEESDKDGVEKCSYDASGNSWDCEGVTHGAMSAAFRVAFNDLVTPEVQEGKSFLDALDEINNQLYDALKERGTDQVAFGKGYASGVASVPESLAHFLSVSADMSGINGSAAERNFYIKTRLFEYGLGELAKHGDAFEQALKYSSQYIQQNIGSLSTKRVSYLIGRLSGRSHATKFLPFQYRHLPTIGSFYNGIVNKDLFIANIGVYALLGEELR